MVYPLLLTQWHAQPLSKPEALDLQQRARQREKYHAASRQSCFITSLMHLIADWWLEPESHHDLERVFVYATSRRQQALCHLVTGQLLISRKMVGATTHLDKGLKLADGLIKADDYFTLYNRHETLRYLSLSKPGQAGRQLESLLNEARVIQRLKKHHRHGQGQTWSDQFTIP